MDFITAWGWVCALAGAVSALPQVLRLVRAGTSAGVSLLNWQLVCGTNLAWIVHGALIHAANIIVTNVFVGSAAAAIILMVVRDRRLPLARSMLVVAAVFAACAGVELVIGVTAFGVVIGLPQLVGGASQLRDLATSRLIAGVSLGFLALGVLVQTLWFVWALMAHDRAVLIAAGSMGVLMAVNLAVFVLRRLGVPAIGRPSDDAGPQPSVVGR